jgi:hypothetical protein
MVKTAFSILAVTAVAGIALTPVAASAATKPHVLATSHTAVGGDPDTTVTFTTTSTGVLAMTAPATAPLGTGAVGSTISGSLGTVTVTDGRGLDAAAWTATASSSNWTVVGGGGAANETIPVSDVGYAVGAITTTGTITATGTDLPAGTAPGDFSGTPQTVVAGTAGVGNNTASWNPTISVAVPADVVAADYTGTITQSVA